VYRILKDALARWDAGYGPKSLPANFRDAGGAFDHETYQAALNETVDVIVIDQQPSLTLVQLNGLIAADSVVIPQTMKGFDLATLSTYVSNIGEYLEFILSFEPDIEIGRGEHVILPTIVQEQNDQDTDQILDLYRRAPREILQVWYTRSDAIANASEEYKSIYEYMPPASRRVSARTFMRNANAVNDALVQRVLPDLPKRDFADTFIKERWSAVRDIMVCSPPLIISTAQIDDMVGSDRVGDWDKTEEFAALRDDISRRGQKQAIRVRPAQPDWQPDAKDPMQTDARFVIQSGRRRLAAMRQLGKPVLAVVSTDEGEARLEDLEERFKENTMRQNLSGFEELLSIGLIAEAHQDLSQAEIRFKDLHTTQNSLEDIFVGLVRRKQ
ncbi:hypothetical protein LCGC14_2826060, partial [marine sediment metagenome]